MRFCADSSFVVRLYDPLRPPEEVEVMQSFLDDEKGLVRHALAQAKG